MDALYLDLEGAGYLDLEGAGKIWGVTPRSAWTYVANWGNPEYRKAHKEGTYDPRRHLSQPNPMRPPNGMPHATLWVPNEDETFADLVDELRAWHDRLPGHKHREPGPEPDWVRYLDQPKPYLDTTQVGELLGPERQHRALLAGHKDPGNRPLSPGYVRVLVWRHAKPESDYRQRHLRTGNDPHAQKLADNPMPAPNGPDGTTIWIPDRSRGQTVATLKQQFVAWYRDLPGWVGRPAKPQDKPE